MVAAREMNSPAWYQPTLAWRPPSFRTKSRRSAQKLLLNGDGTSRPFGDDDQLSCFGSSLFVCHAYGLLHKHGTNSSAPERGGPQWEPVLTRTYRKHLEAARPVMRELQALRKVASVSL